MASEPLAQLLTSGPITKYLVGRGGSSSSRATELKVQISLGWVDEEAEGGPALRQVGFRADAEYFYPASSIKLFAAIAALEELTSLSQSTGLPLDADTPLIYAPLFEGEAIEEVDEANLEGGAITVRQEVRKLFLVSDNQAFNRLYELVGQDGLARSMDAAGLPEARIVHRLSESRTVEENRRSPSIAFVGDGFRHELPERLAVEMPSPPTIAGLRVGEAYLGSAGRVEEPLDFSGKNRISLVDLQRGLCKVLRPEVRCSDAPSGSAFRLTEDHRDLILEAMSQLPRESKNPVYDPSEYPAQRTKFLLPGVEKVMPRSRFRIYNKMGRAYGFSTENAWIEDTESGQGFFLAATIYTNQDGVLNDDRYEYETVADPFFADLGEAAARWYWSEELSP